MAASVFTSGGTPIAVDVFKADGTANHPCVIFLYGSDGTGLFPWNLTSIGTWFASRGYNFYLVHFFDKTGTVLATPLVVYQDFGPWLQVINDATTWVGAQPGTDPSRIALMGLSLGTGLAISEASRDLRIKALAAWSGGEATWYESSVRHTIVHLPPTIIVHGANDPLSPLANAYALQGLVQSLGTPVEIDIYPNEGHAFNPTDQTNALQRTLAFFQAHWDQ